MNQADVPNGGKLELLDILTIVDNVLKGDHPPEEPDNAVPEPLSGSF
ncbi:hypothetical protein [Methylobacterium bullatum]|uniref:Uncharacterized protein n=1 Tax=Methylobacterium bullatum TaxID=570505 RepID=A0AAV4ZCX5_9HYPH|nr:hypothetical protein [Methylobacterium bullatum]GJD41913.1 hypothetical protein OICFNHDK_4397 [Methylobacterium bullatum]